MLPRLIKFYQVDIGFLNPYPTIKNRLNRIGEALSFVEIGRDEAPTTSDVLARLEQGAITAEEAIQELKVGRKEKEDV